MLVVYGRALLGPENRGSLLDLVVFLVNIALARALGALANDVVHAAVDDVRAKLAVGLFFAALVIVQPLGPILKRWSFHQRHAFSIESGAGCVVFYFMFVYLVMMFALCGAATVMLGEVVFKGSEAGVALILPGFAWSIISVVFVYRYFVRPAKPPRWTFLSTPAAAHAGDVCIYLNAIGLQIIWGSLTASAWFHEAVTHTPLGKPGSITDVLGRLVATAIFALLLYFPARIYYLAEDKHRAQTWATMLLANLPLILRIVFAPAAHA